MRFAVWSVFCSLAWTGVARSEDIELVLEGGYEVEATLTVSDRDGLSELTSALTDPSGGSGSLALGSWSVKRVFEHAESQLEVVDSALIGAIEDDRLICSTLLVSVSADEEVELQVRREVGGGTVQALLSEGDLPETVSLIAADLSEGVPVGELDSYWYGCFRITRADRGSFSSTFTFELVRP
jgi:hypothetical protein